MEEALMIFEIKMLNKIQKKNMCWILLPNFKTFQISVLINSLIRYLKFFGCY